LDRGKVENFPSNSQKQKPVDDDKAPVGEAKKIEKITTGKVLRRKKPLSKRLAETFIGGDAKGVWGYVLYDVLIPAAKDMIADAGREAIERMLFNEPRSPSRRGLRTGGVGNVSYHRYAQAGGRREDPRPQLSRRARAAHNFDEIVLPNRAEAEAVIEQMFDVLSQYQAVSVSDLYEMVGITPQFTDEKYGWTDIRGAGVTRIQNGYLLDLPRPDYLE
jgi:hypothetical protein